MGLAPYLDPRFFLVSVRAPFAFPYGGYTWYDVGTVGTPEPGMFQESFSRLTTFVQDALKGYPIDPGRLCLFGFSMGTVMSYALSLTHPEFIRAVAANSGYVPEGTDLTFRWNDLAGTEFFITHGTHDEVIPVEMGHRARDLFRSSRAPYTYHEYPMGHQISEESLADVSGWLTRILGR